MLMGMLQQSALRRAGRGSARRRAALAVSVLAVGLLAGAPAAAEYASRTIEGWTVAVSKDAKGCFLTREFDRNGGTTLLLGLDVDGSNHLSVLNPNWSIKPKEQLKLTYRLSRGDYPGHFAVGIQSEGKQGFVSTFEPKFPAYFAASKALHIARGDVPVARLDLQGSGAAVAELRQCVSAQKSGASSAAADGSLEDGIPKDPFAVKPERKGKR
ncbi:hypothetical protein [Sphingomonas mucosissima]|uniref:Uncharacterized protein n=1 Tax=Sphingomonas mucosissima TaxID=370959 RepID=A0A245ZJC7_9SPHN|nr:hypothetical protein [Sphingomonas mucosissima]OWK29850.1 hypothetical protein SPMU_22720 [Sphingomonas mucosissima]